MSLPKLPGMRLQANISEDLWVPPGVRQNVPTGLVLQYWKAPLPGYIHRPTALPLDTPFILEGLVEIPEQELKVRLWNVGNEYLKIKPGEALAELTLALHFSIEWKETSQDVDQSSW